MTEINRHLIEEVVLDYADDLINRHEALRRLSLLGVGTGLAGSMLAACYADNDDAPGGSATGFVPGVPAGPLPRPTEAVTFAGPQGTLQGAWAAAAPPRGSVLVIHEHRGLTGHIRAIAGRLAASGFSALAIDLLSEEGGAAKFADPAKAAAALNAVPPARFVADMKAGVTELRRRVSAGKTGAVGFCVGGGMVWSLLASGEPRLGAAVPFYGPLPANADLAGSPNAAVLAIYAELDTRVNASRDAARAALEKARLTHEIVTYSGANHAFFNDAGERHNAAAAKAAYQRLVDWFGTHLA